MQSSRERLEDLVRLAIQCDLVGAERRRALLDGLPTGFIYSLPTVSRPIDQLRFDLMELQRTPRLIGLDRPPLVVWLINAAETCATSGHADAARTFAQAADAIAPTGAVARVEAALDAQRPRAVAAGDGAGGEQSSDGAYDIFLAYSGQTRAFAERLYDTLVRKHAKSVFLDVRSLVPGDTWDIVIPDAQARARATCVIASPATARGWYQREEIIQAIRRARKEGSAHRIIPILLDGMDPEDMPYGLGRLHGITVGRGDTAGGVAARIVAALDRRAAPAGASMASILTEPSADAPFGSGSAAQAASAPAAEAARPLRVLFLADDPRRDDRAALTTEARRIEQAIRSNQARDAITIAPRFALRYQDLVTAITEVEPDLVHFAGTGDVDGIRFVDENTGKHVPISARGLAGVMSLADGTVRGVILNASHSARLAADVVTEVEFAIGMTGEVSEAASLDFAGAFYGAIARGRSVAAAVKEAAVMMQMRSEAEGARPLLHLRPGVDGDRLVLRPGR
ncbi:MAG: TIR domain-containing protein [bacterium]